MDVLNKDGVFVGREDSGAEEAALVVLDDDALVGDSNGVHVATATAHEGVDEAGEHALRVDEVRHLALGLAEPEQVVVAGARGLVLVQMLVGPLANHALLLSITRLASVGHTSQTPCMP